MKRVVTALVLACLGASVLAACSGTTIQPGSARLSFERARVQVATGGRPFRGADGGLRLGSGDRVKVVTGEAVLHLAKDARLLLHKGSEVSVYREPVLAAGDVVADVGDTPLTVRSSGSEIHVLSGASRIRSGLALTAGVYSGAARLLSAGRSLDVPTYRQGSVISFGVLSRDATALEYSDSDPWDVHYLDAAVEIGRELQRRSDGFTAQLRPTEGQTPGFYTGLLPDLRSGALDECGALGSGRRPGEVLVGATLALQARPDAFDSRCRAVFEFRDEGATWGLVALDQGARSLPKIRDELVAAIGRLPAAATITALGAPVAPGPSTPSTPTVVVPSAPTAPTTGGAPSAPAPPPTPTPSPSPVPSTPVPPVAPLLPPTPDPVGSVLAPVTNLVDNLLNGLLG
jgi:hypothetical protein